MPPPLPSYHRGMTANPLKPVGRYRPGKPIAEDPSSSEEEEEEEDLEAQRGQERRQAEAQRRRQQAPKASSFPAAAARKAQVEEDEDEEGFVTEEEEDETAPAPPAKAIPQPQADQTKAPTARAAPVAPPAESEDEEEDDEEESSEEESSSEDEAPRRMLIRPTFIKKDKRANAAGQDRAETAQPAIGAADSAADSEARRVQRQEKADQLVRDQLEKEAIARSSGNRAWDDDELVQADEEAEIDDRDGVDPDAEYAAWKLRELKRVKREREAIEEAEKEREEVERRRNLTAEERDREDREFLAQQKEERDATRGQTGFMQRYFHKGAFFRDDLEREGLDQRNVMGRRFADDVAVETLPQYMQVRDMTKLGKKGRTRYRDLKSEDTGRFGEGYENRRRRDGPPVGITDERFMPDRGDDRGQGPTGPTGANASAVRRRRRSRSRSYSPRRDRRGERSRSRERRKRSPSPYDDRDKRRRVDSTS
ncbi:uncharacterized protein N7459_003197 [Penicillium hispanicum]|uniref:uncharacterized protein n=1 Tax=Penicillium hispanicum TaxID=1080232 RepID=UPI002541DF8E|nr:uncharacterized protein N7459_003197 [Penicillium hispanicum]KAJ5587432.1 hypothetical protein N7459_003197 [Penicillium hispanicum]